MKYSFLAVILPLACSSPSADVSSAEGPLGQLAELVCDQAASCSCRFGFASVSECVETRMSMDRARQYPGASELHLDADCAAQWLEALAFQGCSTEAPTTPGCYVAHGDLGKGEGCNAHDECALGLQCIWGQCQTWGEVGDRCDWDRHCEGADLYCGANWTCRRLPTAGEECDSSCALGTFCYEGICISVDAPCGGCGRDEVCRQGSCMTPIENGESCDYYWQCHSEACDPYGNVCIDPDPAICDQVVSRLWQ